MKGAAAYMNQLGLNGSAWEEQQIDGFSLMQFAEIVTPPFLPLGPIDSSFRALSGRLQFTV